MGQSELRAFFRALVLGISYVLILASSYHFGDWWGVALAFGSIETLYKICER